MNWIDQIFDKKISKEAGEITDATTEFQKKVKASNWLKETMGVSEEELAKEAEAKMQNEITLRDALRKEAAYEPFQTMDVTIDHDFARDAAILSDYQLSEWLAECRARAEGVPFPENASELKAKAVKDVASDRKGCEKELIRLVGQNTLLDWQKNFKKFTDEGTPKQPEAKELYQPKLDKVNDDISKGGKVDGYALTDEQHEKTMQGVGRDEHSRTDVTEQAGETKNEALGKISEKTASLVRDPERELRIGTIVRLARTVMTKEGFLLPAGSAWEISAINGFHYTISANGQSHTISSHDTPKFDTIKKNASQEIENHSTKEQILVKIAECVSPWVVTKDSEGNDVIARVENNSNTKQSEETKKEDLQK
jgi:hypothetical protein